MKLERANNTVSQMAAGATTFAAFSGPAPGGDRREEDLSPERYPERSSGGGGASKKSAPSSVSTAAPTPAMGAPTVAVKSPISSKGGGRLDESADDFADANLDDLLAD